MALKVVVSHETPASIAEPTLRAAWIAAQAFAAGRHLNYELFEPNDHPYDCPTWNAPMIVIDVDNINSIRSGRDSVQTRLELRKCDGSGEHLAASASLPTTRPVDVFDMERSMKAAFAALNTELDAHHPDFFIRAVRL